MPGNIVLVHAGEDPPDAFQASIFLAGPTPRTDEFESWRPGAIDLITLGWHGGDPTAPLAVFVPEPRDGRRWPDYDINRAWELCWGDRADVVLFWIPRRPGMEGRTTNDEWGRWKDTGRAVLGTPPDALQVRYQRDYATEVGVPLADDLAATVANALAHIGHGARRAGGHRNVPLLLWRTESFQRWLTAQTDAGNLLRSGRLEWTHRIGDVVLFWAFRAVVWVAAEGREKSNEVVFSRPDVATVVAYRRAPDPLDSEVVLVREFRTPATSADGFVRELPGGSGRASASPIEQAIAELAEETGIHVYAGRVRTHHARQPVATLSAHHQHVFSVELTAEEIDLARASTEPHGVAEDTERTYPEVHTLQDLINSATVDWATLGAITAVLLTPRT